MATLGEKKGKSKGKSLGFEIPENDKEEIACSAINDEIKRVRLQQMCHVDDRILFAKRKGCKTDLQGRPGRFRRGWNIHRRHSKIQKSSGRQNGKSREFPVEDRTILTQLILQL